MRLRIKEQLKDYNLRKGERLKMRDLAHRLYSHDEVADQYKYNKLSAINTGVRTAKINELVDLAAILDCSVIDLLESQYLKSE